MHESHRHHDPVTRPLTGPGSCAHLLRTRCAACAEPACEPGRDGTARSRRGAPYGDMTLRELVNNKPPSRMLIPTIQPFISHLLPSELSEHWARMLSTNATLINH
eukprot:4736340-Prymnesium_polylepis.1